MSDQAEPIGAVGVVEAGWQPLKTAPYDKTVLIDCDRFGEVIEAIQYRHEGWKTFSVNGTRDCLPIAWMHKPARSEATPTAAPAPNVQALVEACEPFAHAAEPIISDHKGEWNPDKWNHLVLRLKVGQFRALAAALAAIQAPAGEGVSPPAGDRGQG